MTLANRHIHRGLAFAAGLGVAAIPSVGPFLALLAIFTGRLVILRSDAWWWGSAVLLGAPFAVTGHLAEAALTMAQVLAVWLIYRSAVEFRQNARSSTISNDIGAGLVVGLAITLGLGLRHIGEFRFDVARTALDAVVWNTHPSVFGHAILVISALVALVVPSPRLRALAMAIGAVGVVFSGAREAVWAWLLIAVGLRFAGRRGTKWTRVAEWALIALMAVLASGLPAWFGLGRTGFLTDLVPPSSEANLFRGTEVVNGDWWYPLGVEFSGHEATVDGRVSTVFDVTKLSSDPWSRLQQVVTLTPDETYTLSALLHSTGETSPGFDGWGREAPDSPSVNLATTLRDGTHRVTASGAITAVSSSAVELGGGWELAIVTFRYDGSRPLTWYVGVVPDRSNLTGVTTSFAELQLVASYSLLPYRPGPATRGVTDLRTSRFPIWQEAFAAVSARPLFGWGPNGFPTAVARLHPDEVSLRPVAAHAHNSFLSALVERGSVGLLGLVLLFALLAIRAIQQRDRAAAVVLTGVLVLNMFDSTFLSGAVIYPLAAVMGWRAVGRREVAEAETGVGSAVAVRLALALADAAAGAGALSVGIAIAAPFEPGHSVATALRMPLAYATLAWPALAAAAGLYPGYGLPSHKKLAQSVRASSAAAVAVGFLALVLPEVFGLNAAVFLVAVPTAAVLAPLLRHLTQGLLQRLRLWGRPVVILGTEPAAAQAIRHLLDHPSVGLHPMAVFGGTTPGLVGGLPVAGSLDEAWSYVERNDVRHVIISADAASEVAFDNVLLQPGNRLKYVQYLPDLTGLPTNSVVAAPLGTTLALEARNQLASGTNRAVKRVTDLVGATLLLAVLGLPLLVIAILIRFDSRGPALYHSPRIGRYGRTFGCIKFRTMHYDADERLATLLTERPELREEYERYHKLENDPRVTRVGRFLRRTSLDELPQLLNVFVGQMSLVGPRPYMVRERSIMGGEQDLIFLARPGMTGYWQTEARNDVSFEERQSMEAHYVRNWSLWWDIDILLRTPGAVMSKTGK